jgi:GTP-binding protein
MKEPFSTIQIPRAEFLRSVNDYSAIPKPELAEICILGRSNVGKSSFINHLFADHSLARVSKTPGKTIQANFYQIDKSLIWVDLPGYGYSRRSASENNRITELIKNYCTQRENLKGVLWLLDIRHPGMDADLQAFQWLSEIGVPLLPILTKADTLSRGKAQQQIGQFDKVFRFGNPVLYSIHNQECREIFWRSFIQWSNLKIS